MGCVIEVWGGAFVVSAHEPIPNNFPTILDGLRIIYLWLKYIFENIHIFVLVFQFFRASSWICYEPHAHLPPFISISDYYGMRRLVQFFLT